MAGSVKPGVLIRPADAVAEVASQRLDQRDAAPVAVGLLGLLDAAKRDQRLPPRLAGRHAGAQVVVDVQLQVAGELFVELALTARTAEERSQREPPRREGASA